MKQLENFGLGIFLTGFIIFLASFFMSSFRLTNEAITQSIPAKKIEIFTGYAENLIDKEITSNFKFENELEAVFNKFNQEQVRKYGLSLEDINQLTTQILSKDGTFSESVVLNYFDDEDPIILFKKNKIIEYGNWMLNKNYSDEAQLRKDLQVVKENIEKYGILNLHGFDKYLVKNLKFTITKYSSIGPVVESSLLFILLTYGLCCLGALLYLIPKKWTTNKGVQNDGIFHSSLTAQGWLGIVLGTFLIAFYVILYYYPEYMTNWVVMMDPISYAINGSEAGRFFLYGFIYTICVLVMGVRMTIKYRHSNYHLLRTGSVMFFQLAFAFLIPEIMTGLSQPYFDFKNIWPLDYDFFFDSELNALIQHGGLGIFMLVWGLALIIIAVPVFTYFLGKRWYCSWVCGCGGLAETLGDPFRQLSDKSLKAWKIERWMVHGVFVLAIGMTALVLYTYFTGESQILFLNSYKVRETYGFWVGAGFAGVVGTGFYPLMGNRVWCRFGCPLAAYLGLIQRFKSRFRITTNGGQCISCGNCSTYCEMGIDVRSYAQKGENIVRSSCVGCGVCASVCPRGVLKLENADEASRLRKSPLVG